MDGVGWGRSDVGVGGVGLKVVGRGWRAVGLAVVVAVGVRGCGGVHLAARRVRC